MKVPTSLKVILNAGSWTSRRGSLALLFLGIFSLTEATLSAQYTITPVLGGGGYQFDGRGVAVDGAGNVYATAHNGAPFVVKVNLTGGAPTPVAGSNNSPYWGSTTCQTTAPTSIGLSDLGGVAVDASGNVYVAQSGGGPIVKISGNTFTCPFGNTGYGPLGIAVDSTGHIYFSDTYTPKFYRDAVPIASIYGSCANVPFGDPRGLATDAGGNLYVADHGCDVIWKVTPQLNMTPVAGAFHAAGQINCPANNVGDGGAATSACLDQPGGVAVDLYGNLYIADWGNNRVRRVDYKTGIITTIAGNGLAGNTASGVPATSTPLGPYSISIGPGGKIYVGVENDSSMNFLYELTPTGAMMISPAPGSMLRPPVTFTWGGAPANSMYQLDVGENSVLPGTNYVGNLFSGSMSTTASPQISGFGCDEKTINAQLTTTNATAGVSQTGVYTYTACMLSLSLSVSSPLPATGGPITVSATITSQTSQTVTLNVTESVVYPPQPCYISFWTHTTVCPTPAVIGSKSISLVAGVPQTIPFTVNFGNRSGYVHVITTYEFAATLTGANGQVLDSTANYLTQD